MSRADHPSQRPVGSLGWWVIHGDEFLDALRRAGAGEDPDLLYAEFYANSDTEDYTGEVEE